MLPENDDNLNAAEDGNSPAADDATPEKDILNGPNSDAEGDDDKSTSAADDDTDKDADTDGDSDKDGDKEAGDDDQGAPESYADFEMPEGVEVDETQLAEAAPLFKELGLTQAQAQKLVDFQATQVQAGRESQIDAFNQMVGDWREQSVNDKEFGGDKFEESINIAQTTIDKLGTPELGKLLKDHGVGNHPEVIRILVKMGGHLQEDQPGGGDNTPNSPEKSHVEALYPNDNS